jgi:Fe-S-cluster containining protein
MSPRKFMGKVHQDPGEALAKGSREVMASIWEDYLAAILRVSATSGRFKILRRQIDAAAGFKEVFDNWNTLPLAARGAAWRRLMTAAGDRYEATKETCVRCGECCRLGSPTLLSHDLPRFQQEILTWNDVYTLRPGEQVTNREGEVEPLKEERLKVREVPGSRQCWFYLAATDSCRIYDDRPEQCRRQNCWGDPARPPAVAQLLNRQQLLAGVPEVWALITEHQERCDLGKVARALTELDAGREEASETLFEALHFDHYLRQMLISDWELTPAATELLLGRPVAAFLQTQGIIATLTPEGVFKLARQEAAPEK